MGDKSSEQPKERVEYSTFPDVSFSEEISTATLVKLLVRKGIFTTNEIIDEERQTRLSQQIALNRMSNHTSQKKRKQSWFKRWAGKKRCRRRLTSLLFGWEWKKTKHSHSSPSQEWD